MPEWELNTVSDGSYNALEIYRGKEKVAKIFGIIGKNRAGEKYFEIGRIEVEKKYQKEFIGAQGGVKLGEALFHEFLNFLKERRISLIEAGPQTVSGKRFFERFSKARILEPREGTFFKVVKYPAKSRIRKLARRERAREALAKAKAKPKPKPRRRLP